MNLFCWRFLRNEWYRVDRAAIPEELSVRWAAIHSDRASGQAQKGLWLRIISGSLNEQYWA